MFSPVSVCLLTGLLKNYCSNLYGILWEWKDIIQGPIRFGVTLTQSQFIEVKRSKSYFANSKWSSTVATD